MVVMMMIPTSAFAHDKPSEWTPEDFTFEEWKGGNQDSTDYKTYL